MSDPRRVPHRPYLVAEIASLIAGDRGVPAVSGMPMPTPTPIEDRDLDAVGTLMAEAFRGTVDDEGETAEQLADQLREATGGAWGDPLRDGWLLLAGSDGRPVSAVVTTRWWGTPFVAMVATLPSHRGRGIASALIREAVRRSASGEDRAVGLIVTRDNPALRLYTELGFVETDRPG